ncbi:lipopolysaccharide biosynthesis protein [Telmatospirillum siberiense]|uniref:Translocase n=1 Tax=Telmatospirillum siberiense TaxID=382514 RepID=A0A2N3PS79_9PROT|nr:oligosaccharide flippase family protein [Telmatospirillum siberiense]PKU23234.1 hypothetical protein CWS72_17570 [Telmatospirillum siberiense]
MRDTSAREMGITPGRRGLAGVPGALIRRIRDILARRPFLKNVSIMLGGAAGGQLVSILLSPLLTRLYSPQQFGILSVYSAVLAILVVIASLRYEMALPLTRLDEDAANLMAVCLCALAATTAAVGSVVFLLPGQMIEALWPLPLFSERIGTYRILLVVGYVCLGGYFIALYGATRTGAFRAIAKTRFGQGVVGPLSQIVLGLLGVGTPGLLLGFIAGQSAGTAGLFYNVATDRPGAWSSLSWRRMRGLAARYCRFPLVSSWAALIDALGSSQLLYLLISLQYSARIAGYIFLVERVVSRPLAIVGTSILQVFMSEAGRTATSDPDKLKSRFRQVVFRQFCLAAAWVLAANLAGALLFPTVFGEEWIEGIVYLKAMSLGYLAQALVQPVFHTLQILEKQILAAGWQIGRLIFTVGVFEAGARLYGFDAPWVIAGYSAAQALCCLVLLALMARSIRQLKRKEP